MSQTHSGSFTSLLVPPRCSLLFIAISSRILSRHTKSGTFVNRILPFLAFTGYHRQMYRPGIHLALGCFAIPPPCRLRSEVRYLRRWVSFRASSSCTAQRRHRQSSKLIHEVRYLRRRHHPPPSDSFRPRTGDIISVKLSSLGPFSSLSLSLSLLYRPGSTLSLVN